MAIKFRGEDTWKVFCFNLAITDGLDTKVRAKIEEQTSNDVDVKEINVQRTPNNQYLVEVIYTEIASS